MAEFLQLLKTAQQTLWQMQMVLLRFLLEQKLLDRMMLLQLVKILMIETTITAAVNKVKIRDMMDLLILAKKEQRKMTTT